MSTRTTTAGDDVQSPAADVRSSTIDLFPLPPSPVYSQPGRPSSTRSSASGTSSVRFQQALSPADAGLDPEELEERRRRRELARILADKRAAASGVGRGHADGSPGPGSYFQVYGSCSTSIASERASSGDGSAWSAKDGPSSTAGVSTSSVSGAFVQLPLQAAMTDRLVRPPLAPAAASTQQWLADDGALEVLSSSSRPSSTTSFSAAVRVRRRSRRLLSDQPPPPRLVPPPLYPPPTEPPAHDLPPLFPFLSQRHSPSPTPSVGASTTGTTPTRSSWGMTTTAAGEDHTGSRSIEDAQIVAAEIRYRGREGEHADDNDCNGDWSVEGGHRVDLRRTGSAASKLVFAPGRIVGASSPVASPPHAGVHGATSVDARRGSYGLGAYPFLTDPPPTWVAATAPRDYPFASKLATASSPSAVADEQAGRRASSSPSVASSFRSGKAKRWVFAQLPAPPPILKRRSSRTSSYRGSISTFASTPTDDDWPKIRRSPSRIRKREAEMSLNKLIRRAQRVRTLLDDRGGTALSTPTDAAAFMAPPGLQKVEATSSAGSDGGAGYIHYVRPFSPVATASGTGPFKASGLRSWTSMGGGGSSSQRTPSNDGSSVDAHLGGLDVRLPISEEGSGQGRVKEEVSVVLIGFGRNQPQQTRGVRYASGEEKDLPPLPHASRLSHISSFQVSVHRLRGVSKPRLVGVVVVALLVAILIVGLLAGLLPAHT